MTDSSDLKNAPDSPFPVPGWARATAFVGFLALSFAGGNQLEQAVVALLELSEIDGSPLEGLGIMAAFVFFLFAQPYSPLVGRNEAIYVTACMLINVILAFGAATATLIANLGLLNPAAKTPAAEIARDCARSLKTASAMGVDTTLGDIQKLYKRFGVDLEITACGSISLAEQALDFLEAGADSIGTPTPFSIIAGYKTLVTHRGQEL